MNYLAASYEVSKTEKFGTQQAAGNKPLSASGGLKASKFACLFVQYQDIRQNCPIRKCWASTE
jgi:hypothetical protein